MKNKKSVFNQVGLTVCMIGGLASSAIAEDVKTSIVPLDIYNFDPNAEPVKGSAVSEFEWAIDAVDDICKSDNRDDYMQPICKTIRDISEDLKTDYYLSFYGQDVTTTLTELQKRDALHMAARLQLVFGQVSDVIKICDFDEGMECHTIYFEGTGEYKTFAFP